MKRPTKTTASLLFLATLSASAPSTVLAQKSFQGMDFVPRGYGPVPATGTKIHNGWMCFEWAYGDSGKTVAIRAVNTTSGSASGGDVACYSETVGSGCKLIPAWFGNDSADPWSVPFGDFSRCEKLIETLSEDAPYLACGEGYQKLFGWPGYDDGDPDSWCVAGALALDIRPDAFRHKDDTPPMNTTFFNAVGRQPNYPTKEQRMAPRPEGDLMGECKTFGWGCQSCDEVRYQCNDDVTRSCSFLGEIPASCPGNGVRDKSLESALEKNGGVFTKTRYTQTTGRTPTIVAVGSSAVVAPTHSTVAAVTRTDSVITSTAAAVAPASTAKPGSAGSNSVKLAAALAAAGVAAFAPLL